MDRTQLNNETFVNLGIVIMRNITVNASKTAWAGTL